MNGLNTDLMYEFDEDIYYFDDYVPFSHGQQVSGFDKKIMDLKDYSTVDWKVNKQGESRRYFLRLLGNVFRENITDVVICRIPRSKMHVQENHIYTICKDLCSQRDIIDGTKVLQRIADVDVAHLNGTRNMEKHLASIAVRNKELIRNKKVILVDDVITSGSTMYACKQLLLGAGARRVIGMAMGRSVDQREI